MLFVAHVTFGGVRYCLGAQESNSQVMANISAMTELAQLLKLEVVADEELSEETPFAELVRDGVVQERLPVARWCEACQLHHLPGQHLPHNRPAGNWNGIGD